MTDRPAGMPRVADVYATFIDQRRGPWSNRPGLKVHATKGLAQSSFSQHARYSLRLGKHPAVTVWRIENDEWVDCTAEFTANQREKDARRGIDWKS